MSEIRNGLPSGWVKTKVGECFTVVGGGTPSTERAEYWDGDIPWVTSADISEDRRVSPRRKITRLGVANSATNLVPPRSVLVATRVGLGRVGLTTEAMCFSQDCQALLFDERYLSPSYVATNMARAVADFRHIGRGTTISGVTKAQLLNVDLLLPPPCQSSTASLQKSKSSSPGWMPPSPRWSVSAPT